jgi:general nucleoside transport system permease protein
VIRLERRLETPRFLSLLLPLVSVALALVLAGVLLLATGHDPLSTYRRIVERGFTTRGALSATLVSATPLAFTGLAAAAAFRMRLWNIGGEGQLYLGAAGGAGAGLYLGHHGAGAPLLIVGMIVGGFVAGALWGAIPGVLRAVFHTNEIIVSLMLNYVALQLIYYLIFGSQSYWRDTSSPTAKVFPQGAQLVPAAIWPHFDVAIRGTLAIPLGFLVAAGLAVGVWALYARTRAGFAMRVLGDSPRAARYAGVRTRRTIVGALALSGGIAGVGGASQVGDFSHVLDPKGLQGSGYGYAGIVVAALARLNPFAAIVVAILFGGLQNAGFSLQGADFSPGLVGMLQGMILFCALGTEVFARYRFRWAPRRSAAAAVASTGDGASA